MKIGIYGGSFNPPHLGHMAAAESAAKYLGLDELLLIPAGIPPHKMLSADAAGAEDRLAMTRLMGEQIALDTGVKVTVSDMEIARGGKSYTADTLRILHEEHPDDELWLLMGTDMFLTFQYWYKPDEIVRYAGLCAFGRTEKDGEELFAPQRKYLGQRFPGSRIVTMTLPNLVDVSSTELRARIPKRETDGLLAPAVLGYIYRKHLYGTNLNLKRLTLEDLRPIALSYLKAKRIPHVLGTEQTAAALAEKYGADALLVVTPYYNKATQKGLIAHYTAVAESVSLPVIMYNVPSRTGCNIQPETAVALAKNVKNIVGIKEASGNISQVAKLMQLADGCIELYSGNDDQVVPILSLGGNGVISVLSNVAPRQTHDMVMKYLEGDLAGSLAIQLAAIPVIDKLFCEVNPIPVKAALNQLGFQVGPLRMPLTEMEPEHQAQLKQAMIDFGIEVK